MDDVHMGKKVPVSYVATIKLIPDLSQLFFRFWLLSWITPNTISRAVLMSTVDLDIEWLSCAPSVPLLGSSSHTSIS